MILKKLEFYRDGGSKKHLRDIAGVLRISRGLDREYIERWCEELGVIGEWREVRELAD